MDEAILLKYDRRVPRYTSYPTAPHFDAAVGAREYRRWLERLDPAIALSLYIHVPFCSSLCWFCGCQTTVVKSYRPVAAYLDLLAAEIDMVADVLRPHRRVAHVHWGGGTPTILKGSDLLAVMARLRRRFDLAADAEVAVEVDPRSFDPGLAAALAAAGVDRASLGIQDFAPKVQQAVNRRQSFDVTKRGVESLRANGIDAINFDLMYGLPHQTVPGIVATVDQALELAPDRIALFGYAHVPWMRRHQRLIDESALPGARLRLALYRAAGRRLAERGYVAIGLDHFARPADPLAEAQGSGRLRRNFEGYTTDDAGALIGFGASAIATLPQGYAQNAAKVPEYRKAIEAGDFATVRGIGIDDEDRLRRDVIGRLMCDLGVDVAEACRRYDQPPDHFAPELARLAAMGADGLLTIDGPRVLIREQARPIVRTVCAAFDRYLQQDEVRHSAAL